MKQEQTIWRHGLTSVLALGSLALGVMSPAWSMASSASVETPTVEAPQASYAVHWSTMNMGTFIQAQLYVEKPEDATRFVEILDRGIVDYDNLFSVHHASPLQTVNDKAGQWVKVPEEVAQLTQRALDIARESHGVFQPMIGPIVNVWKIGFGGKQVPSDEAIAKAVSLVDDSKVDIKKEGNDWWMRIAPGQSIDLGGIAKGYIGTALAEKLTAAGLTSGFLDLGGNVVLIGTKPANAPWRVGLQVPDSTRGEYFAVVQGANESLVTSGAYERFIEVDGKRYAHILSAVTGRPVHSEVASVTILSPDGTFADAWCTALFAMGWEGALQWLKDHPQVKAVLMKTDMKTVVLTAPAEPFVRFVQDDLHVTVVK